MLFLAAVLAVVVGSSTAFVSWRRTTQVSTDGGDAGSLYRTTRPGVGYLGDAACARCHAEIAQSYRQHPMGRSLAPIAAAPATGADGEGGRVLFEAQGLEYSLARRDGRVIHQEARRDHSGRVIARREAEVQFAVGSGRQGVAYLIERDGFLFQSPITWYVRERRWDLSPGYEKNNLHFDRAVTPGCLFCHANRVEPVEGTVNRYQPPLFRGHSIGCERCHGPGALHAQQPQVVAGQDRTIVNPAELEPSLRDAVCEQCHLIGHRRVARLDRRAEEFRPGLPFHQFWSVKSNRCTRAVVSAPAGVSLAASPATIPIGFRYPRRRWPIIGVAAWSATPIGAVASRRRPGWSGAARRIAWVATCPGRAARTSSMPR
jgi:hypothetical protein